MDNLGMIPNNGAPNFNSGLWPMPEDATASEADGSINMAGLIHSAATGAGASDGTRMGESAPPVGGNDGTIADGWAKR